MNNTKQQTGITDCIDSHQHFWHYHRLTHEWITDEMSAIRKDFFPADLEPVLKENGVAGCVSVQADQTEKETMFLLEFAEENSFIRGVVGWVDLRAEAIEERLQYFRHFPKLKGFRHVLQGETPEFMLQPDFLRGVRGVGKSGYTYDILIFPQHLKAATQLVSLFPDQPFVVDHIAKPYIKKGLIDEWRKDISTLAQYPNVYCKISGMVTEADFGTWKPEDFTPYLDVVVGAFGISRIMYGSDWPVCLVAASYTQMMHIVKDYFAAFSKEEQALFFGGNAVRFYRL
jgi:L-fuconolactonase